MQALCYRCSWERVGGVKVALMKYVQWVCLQFVFVVFSDHTHFLFFNGDY